MLQGLAKLHIHAVVALPSDKPPDLTPPRYPDVGVPVNNKACVQSALMRSTVSFLMMSDEEAYFALDALLVCMAYFSQDNLKLVTHLAELCEPVSLLTQAPALLCTTDERLVTVVKHCSSLRLLDCPLHMHLGTGILMSIHDYFPDIVFEYSKNEAR